MINQNFEDVISECEMHELLYYVSNELFIEEIMELVQKISSETSVPISDKLDLDKYIMFLGDNAEELTIKRYLCNLNNERQETIMNNKIKIVSN